MMNCAACWLNFKQRNFNFSAALIFLSTILAWTRVDASLCKQGWMEWNSMCYKLKRINQNWITAQSSCEADGANLVSIGSKDEYLFVLSQLHAAGDVDIWIGLNDIVNEGQFQWTDQSLLTFTNMSSTSTNIKLNCVQFSVRNNEWVPLYCLMNLESMCKYIPNIIKEDFSMQANYTRQQLYTSMQDKLLLNHVLIKRSTPSLLHCTLICLREAECMSLNYRSSKNSQIGKGLCLLNSVTAAEFPEDFVDNSAYIYSLPIK